MRRIFLIAIIACAPSIAVADAPQWNLFGTGKVTKVGRPVLRLGAGFDAGLLGAYVAATGGYAWGTKTDDLFGRVRLWRLTGSAALATDGGDHEVRAAIMGGYLSESIVGLAVDGGALARIAGDDAAVGPAIGLSVTAAKLSVEITGWIFAPRFDEGGVMIGLGWDFAAEDF